MELEVRERSLRLLRRAWRRLRRVKAENSAAGPAEFADIAPEDLRIVERVSAYTMTSPERLLALLGAVPYVIQRGIPGAFAECGVWRGGSVLAMILKLQQLGLTDRDIYLYDTFEGMTEPTAADTSRFDGSAMGVWTAAKAAGLRPWNNLFRAEAFNETSVRELLLSTGYPPERIHFIKGPVEQTIPAQAPAQIALLRLDTDWYESTRHELQHLWPLVSMQGVMVIDDYGHWDGCRKAVDEYFGPGGSAAPVLLNRIDYTGRICIKS